MAEADEELESFRQQWRAEVSARNKGTKSSARTDPSRSVGSASHNAGSAQTRKYAPPPPAASIEGNADPDEEGITSNTYHDLDERETGRRVGSANGQDTATSDDFSRRSALEDPQSALEHYEKAVERETQGSLGDSLNHYRRAFRLDSRVDQTYKNKHFPPSSTAAKGTSPSNTITRPNPDPSQHSLHGHNSTQARPATAETGPSQTLSELIVEFSALSIPAAEPPTSLSDPPPCPISTLPSEILHDILLNVAVLDVACFARLALVCKRLAYLVATEDRIWKRVACGPENGFGAMHYRYDCTILGQPLHSAATILDMHHPQERRRRRRAAQTAPTFLPLTHPPAPYPTYQQLYRYRPRIRFGGCYISTVNYVRPGASSPTQISWNTPVHIVTYYRYLRFFRDGTCLSLLATAEPADVVHHLKPEAQTLHSSGGGGGGSGLPSAAVKSALRGRWRLVGDEAIPERLKRTSHESDGESESDGQGEVSSDSSAAEAGAQPGDVLVETEGVGDPNKYMYKMHLSLRSISAGNSATSGPSRGARNTKLIWKGFWSYNRLTDDWAEFGLRNDRAFFWSRVKSYGLG
ncbi:MAG: hypothetical protein M4579_001441 [Chaenotheca gracillima]|nr:MAG: hypothetical protein M4579_001441 [Chaenotheca gracillima]